MKSILKIYLDDIKSNYKLLNKASNGKAAAVIKANAYGLGVIKVAEALLDAGCYYFYVANIHEGLEVKSRLLFLRVILRVIKKFIMNII